MSGTGETHPIALAFHIIFKIAALVTYLVGYLVTSNYVGVFIACTLLIAADFWTVKNVTGRMLVGLRWWNQIAEDGTSQWFFESLQDTSRLNDREGYWFWAVLGGNTVVWIAFTLFTILSFKWLPLSVLGMVLSGANFMGYFWCRKDAKQKIGSFVAQTVIENPEMMQAAVTHMRT